MSKITRVDTPAAVRVPVTSTDAPLRAEVLVAQLSGRTWLLTAHRESLSFPHPTRHDLRCRALPCPGSRLLSRGGRS